MDQGVLERIQLVVNELGQFGLQIVNLVIENLDNLFLGVFNLVEDLVELVSLDLDLQQDIQNLLDFWLELLDDLLALAMCYDEDSLLCLLDSRDNLTSVQFAGFVATLGMTIAASG